MWITSYLLSGRHCLSVYQFNSLYMVKSKGLNVLVSHILLGKVNAAPSKCAFSQIFKKVTF